MQPPLYIGAFDAGQRTDLKPFMIPEKAFTTLTNAYIFRGRVRRKGGYGLLGRLRRTLTASPFFKVGNTTPTAWTFNLLANTGYIKTANNANPGKVTTISKHGLTNGDMVFISGVVGATGYNTNSPFTITVVDDKNFTIGADATAYGAYVSGGFYWSNHVSNNLEPNASIKPGSVTININGGGQIFTDNGNGTLSPNGTINYFTGAVSLVTTQAVGSAVLITMTYFPGLPVMGIWQHDVATENVEETIFFDTRYAYKYSSVTNQFQDLTTNVVTWSGDDYQLFWATNYWHNSSGAIFFWVTNYNNTLTFDPIRYFDPTSLLWIDFTPAIDAPPATTFMFQALMLIPYKGRLLAFNTWEGTSVGASNQFRQRVRWSRAGDPTDQVQAWRSDISGHGGFLDAATGEEIVSAGFVKDQLIVYFERSTWQLAYTGNDLLPFVFQRVNFELGADSTFSNVRLDNALICFGNIGVHASNGVSTNRIDGDNPSIIFDVSDENHGPERTMGLRDNFRELIYFTYVDQPTNPYRGTAYDSFKFPNRIMVYNYANNTFSFFDDHFTFLGYFQNFTNMVWQDLTAEHPKYPSWEAWGDPWYNASAEQGFPTIVAGNQQGYVLEIDPDITSNDVSLFIQNIQLNTPSAGFMTITTPDHNLGQDTYFIMKDIVGMTGINNVIYIVASPGTANTNTLIVEMTGNESGSYVGGGQIKVLSNFEIKTKQFNPYWSQGQRFRLIKSEYLFNRTTQGQVRANVYVSMAPSTLNNSANSMNDPANFEYDMNPDNTTVWGNNVISTFPEPDLLYQRLQDQIWHRQFYMTDGDTFQFQFTLGDEEMASLVLNESEVTLHGMVLHFENAGEFQ